MRLFYATFTRYRLLIIITALMLVADQATKLWIGHLIPFDPTTPSRLIMIIPGRLYLTHVTNTGSIWGLFPGQSLVLASLAFIAVATIVAFRNSLELNKPYLQLIFGLIIGGILGNFVDRIAYQHVIDFIDVRLPFYHWPTFNIADCGISIGVLLYFLHTIVSRPTTRRHSGS